MTKGLSTTLPTALPARYERLFAWNLDRRCKTVRDVAADLFELWQDLGGVESLSAQKRWLCERVVYLRRRCLAYEAAVLDGTDPPMDAGTYSNHANVLQGYLKSLGLERQAKRGPTLHDYMEGKVAPDDDDPEDDPGEPIEPSLPARVQEASSKGESAPPNADEPTQDPPETA